MRGFVSSKKLPTTSLHDLFLEASEASASKLDPKGISPVLTTPSASTQSTYTYSIIITMIMMATAGNGATATNRNRLGSYFKCM